MNVGRGDIGAVVLALLAVSARASATPCAPRARLTGDDAVVVAVADELRRLGVALGAAAAECVGVDAVVHGDGHGGVVVTLQDGSRAEERDLGAPGVAAAWIDAWLRDDLDWRADAAPGAAATAPARVASVPADAPPALVAQAAPASVSPWSRVSLAGGYEQSWAGDGPSWSGVALAACARVGAWCLGARARYAAQEVRSDQTGAGRADLAALATVSYGIPVGHLVVAPELGLGVGRMTTSRAEACPQPMMCDPTSGACTPITSAMPVPCSDGHGVFVGDHLSSATITPRAAAAVRLTVPLFTNVWLDGSAGVALAPFGHGGAYTSGSSPTGGPDPVALPGEPLVALQIHVGLRVGAL